MRERPITIGHSPDTDDVFMIYGLATGQIETRGLAFELLARDIETLNNWAREARLAVTAMSAHAFAYTGGRYRLLSSGASMGENYGPIVVTRRPVELAELGKMTIAVPGTLTSGFLALRLLLGEVAYRQVRFDQILDEVASGRAEAGLIIYEGQLTFQRQGLHLAVDLGRWWHEQTGGLPFPLSLNAIRSDLDPALVSAVADLLRESIRFGLDHRREALSYALRGNTGLDLATADRFIDQYVNTRTIDMGDTGRRALRELFARGYQRGILPEPVECIFVD